MWWLLALGTVFLAWLIPLWYKHVRNTIMLKDIPGYSQSYFPLVSSLRILAELTKSDKDVTTAAFKFREKIVAEHGEEGIMRMSGSRPFVMVSKAELVEEVLKSPNFAEKSIGYDFMKEWLGNGLLVSKGAVWKAQRRLLTPSFHFKILDEFESAMNEHSRNLVEAMKKDPANLTDVELAKWATDCTMSILLETVMGLEHSEPKANRDYIDSLNKVAHLFAKRFARPWNLFNTYYFNSDEGREYLRAVANTHDFTLKAIWNKILEFKEHPDRMKPRPGRKQAFLDMLVRLFLDGEQLSIEEIREQTDTFMFAGYDTTGWTIAWALFQLGHLPEVQSRVREEITAILGNDKTCALTQDNLKELKYFDRVLKECMRRYPSVPGVSRRCTQHGAKLGKYRLPIDTTVGVSMYFLHRDPNVFPEPEKFDPDRFLPENVQGRNPYAFIPFSAGARNCIGQRFAMQELRIILVNILRNFEVRSKVSLEQIDVAGELILRAKQDLTVDFIPIC